MVRYSRLEFRSLVRKYGAELTFSPMTIANSFCRSNKCRQYEFTTNSEDTPMIVQFAASCQTDFLHATEMIQNYADGVDLNCGCPQRWVMQDGYGSYLLNKPEIIEDMIKTVRRNTPSTFSVSIKIRLLNRNVEETVDFCRKVESMNPTFITIHGRTPLDKSSAECPVNVNALAEIKKSIQIPIIFNGDVTSLDIADKFYEATKCDGMMSARGILNNPALYDGHEKTPISCLQDWLNIHHMQQNRMTFQMFHHHLSFMMESLIERSERIAFNELTKKHQVLEFVKEKFSIEPEKIDYPTNWICTYDDSKYKTTIENYATDGYSTESSHGKFFLEKAYKIREAEVETKLENMNIGSLFSQS